MIKTKDGYAKLVGTTYYGSNMLILLSTGGVVEYSSSSKASTLVLRNSSLLIYATYFNSAISDEALTDIGSVYVRNTSDTFIRRVSKSQFYSIIDGKFVTLDTALTITGNKTFTTQINSTLSTTTYLEGNKGKALINSTASAGTYVMLFKGNSTNGYFTHGVYLGKYLLQYTSKATVDEETNSVTKSVTLLDESGNSSFPGNLVASGKVSGNILESRVATGTKPLNINSTTLVTNLNADLLDGRLGSLFVYINGSLSVSADLNDTVTPGYYKIQASSTDKNPNLPSGAYQYGMLEVIAYPSDTEHRTLQLYFEHLAKGFWRRMKNGTTWQSWVYIPCSTDSIASTTVKVSQHITNNTNYPLVWVNEPNTNSVNSDLYKSWNHLYYNPASRKLTSVGGINAGNSQLTTGTGDIYLEWWRGTNASWRIINTGGTFKFQCNYTSAVLSYYDAFTISHNSGNVLIRGSLTINSGALTITSSDEYRKIQSYGSKPLSINPEGNNVGIGITNPSYKLHVNGTFYVSSTAKFNSAVLVPYTAGSWLSLATRTNIIYSTTNNSSESAHGLYRLKDYNGNAIVFGGLGSLIGFYGFYKSRIDEDTNGTDWQTYWNATNGNMYHSKQLSVGGNVTSNGFVKNGSSNNYILLGGGSHKDINDFSLSSHTHGLLHSTFAKLIDNTTTDSGWSMINSSYSGFILKSLRTLESAPSWIENNYASGICFGGADTKGVLSIAYGNPYVRFAGGNKDKPVWWFRLLGANGATYNLANFSINGHTHTYYWANILVSSSANSATSPTFANIYVNGMSRIYSSSADTSHQLNLMCEDTYAKILSNGSIPLAINPDGNNVGIGLTNPSYKLHVNGTIYGSSISGNTLTSRVATGTAPLTVTSTTKVNNLNADLLDDLHASDFMRKDGTNSITLTGGNGNTVGWRLVLEKVCSGWSINNIVISVVSRHSGLGILSIGFHTTNETGSTYTSSINFKGSTASIGTTAWRAFYNTTTKKFRLYWYYNDYNNTYISVLNKNGFGTPENGTWYETLPSDNGTELSIQYNVATKLGTSTVGGSTTPIYLSSGTPKTCSVSTSDDANTIAIRNSSGDIECRLVRPTYANQSTISGALAYRVNNSTDNYIRFCSDTAAIRTWLGVAPSSHTHPLSQISDLHASWDAILKATPSAYVTRWPSWSEVTNKPTSFTPSSHTHNYIVSRGAMTPQTDRTQSLGDVYSYNTGSTTSAGAPTTYTAVIGFGRGTSGTVEIAGGWTSGMGLWYRSLRDYQDDWYSWRKVWDSGNFDPSDYATTGHTHSQYVTSLGTSGNYLTWTRNGSTYTITVPYATNANTLDGYHANASQNPFNKIPTISSAGVMEVGRYIDFHYDSDDTTDYKTRLLINHSSGTYVATLPAKTGTLAMTSDIPSVPVVTNYYWANIKVSSSSNTSTTPTFGTVNVGNSTEARIKANNYTILRQNGTTLKNLILSSIGGTMHFRPNGDAETSGAMTLDTAGLLNVSNYVLATGFKKDNSSDSYVLLGGGNHKSLADFAKGDAGSSTQGVYVTNGTVTAMTYSLKATVNSGATGFLAYYSNTTNIVDYDKSVGGMNTPIYFHYGIPTECTGLLITYYAKYSISGGTYTKKCGNYNFITSSGRTGVGDYYMYVQYPIGYNQDNTFMFSQGRLNSNASDNGIYVTIGLLSGNKYYIKLADDGSLNDGACYIMFICFS